MVIAPDKFKGSLTAAQAARAIARGLQRMTPGIRTIEVPVADGGDGTLEAFLAQGHLVHRIVVTGPDDDLQSSFIAAKDGTAIIETDRTSGLAMKGGPSTAVQLSSGSWRRCCLLTIPLSSRRRSENQRLRRRADFGTVLPGRPGR